MQVRWIEDFLALVESGSFSKAAKSRNISQPALSRHIQSLEEWLTTTLIHRNEQGVRLTNAGKIFLKFAKDMTESIYTMRSILSRENQSNDATIRFSVSHSLSMSYFPIFLNELKEKLGVSKTHVKAVNSNEGINDLTDDISDLLLIYHHPLLPIHINKSNYKYIVLKEELFAPFKKQGSDILQNEKIPLLSYSNGTYLGLIQEAILLKINRHDIFEKTFDTEMSQSIKAMIKEGHGIGWLPVSCAEDEIEQNKLELITNKDWSTKVEIRMYGKKETLNDLIQEIWMLCETQSIHST